MNNANPPRALLFRRTRRNQRSFNQELMEPLRFSEPEQFNADDWDRALRCTLRKDVLPARISVA